MKKSKPLVISAFILLTIISTTCNNQTACDLTDNQKKLISNEIETIVKNFFNPATLSYETHTALRADKEGYIMGGEGKILFTNYSDYNKSTKLAFTGIQRFTEFETVSIYVYVLCKDAATCTTEFKSKFLTTAGDTITNNGCYTFVFKKFDNNWKIIQENGAHLRK